MSVIPADLVDLLERPLYGALGTIKPNDTVQVNPMWFEYEADADVIRFTHTTRRAKYRNLQHNPSMSLLVIDPDDPLRFLEVRGRLVEVAADPTGAFYVHLGIRYGDLEAKPPGDVADRVVLTMSVERTQRK